MVVAGDRPELPDIVGLSVGVVGGTGEQGRGLAYRLARAGHPVRLGSRSEKRGRLAAAELARMPGVPAELVDGGGHGLACGCDIVILAVPWAAHSDTLRALAPLLAGRIVVDCVNPLGFDERGAYALSVAEGSAAQQAAALLPDARVCAAFHHVSAPVLLDSSVERIEQDVLVLGDDREAAAVVQALASRIDGVRGIWAGRLRNAGQVEALTANLIAINRRYRIRAGLRIAGR